MGGDGPPAQGIDSDRPPSAHLALRAGGRILSTVRPVEPPVTGSSRLSSGGRSTVNAWVTRARHAKPAQPQGGPPETEAQQEASGGRDRQRGQVGGRCRTGRA
ncbi:hypothetical protein GCM10027074_64770 [Streptomyces deserti]